MAYLGNTLINGSLRCLNKAYFNDLSIGNDVEIAGKTTTNQLVVNSGVNPSNLATTNSSTGNIPLIIGNPTGRHIAIDGDEIQNKSSATAYSSLYINYGGGTVCLSTGQKITANNGVFKAESLGASDSRIPNAYITTLDATTGNMEVVNASDITADNLTVNNVLKSSKWDISNVANLANDFMVAPTIKISSSGTVTIASLNTTAKTCRLTFSDSSQINSDEFAGCKWYAGSKVRVTFTVNGTLNSNIEGTIVNNMNTTAGTLVVDVTLDNTTNLANGTYEADDSTIMLYEISNSGTLSPVGIRMTAYGTNNSSYIDMYGGTTASSYTQPVFRIGNLGGITYNGSQLEPQWGVYTYNGYFEGAIVANEGKIANFTIAPDKLYTGTHSAYNTNADGIFISDTYISFGKQALTYFKNDGTGKIGNWKIDSISLYNGTFGTANSAMVCTGSSTAKVIGGSDSISGWTFTSGANFGVTKTGALYANDVNISGAVNATALHVGSSSSTNHLIYENSTIDLQTDWLRFDSTEQSVIIGKTDSNFVKIKERNMAIYNTAFDSGNSDFFMVGDNRYYDSTLSKWISKIKVSINPVVISTGAYLCGSSTLCSDELIIDNEASFYYVLSLMHRPTSFHSVTDASGNVISDYVYDQTAKTITVDMGDYTNYVSGLWTVIYYYDEFNGTVNFGENNNHTDAFYGLTIGSNCSVEGSSYSIAMGRDVIAVGSCATASGYSTVARGNYTNVSGYESVANGDYSVAAGRNCTAIGESSHASGENSEATNYMSFVHGIGLKSTQPNQTVFGKYNALTINDYTDSTTEEEEEDRVLVDSGNFIFVVGNGRNDNDRSNAFTIGENGWTTSSSGFSSRRYNITIGNTPIENYYASALALRDSENATLGSIVHTYLTDGRLGIRMQTQRTINNAILYNQLTLYINDSGVKSVTVSDPKAWVIGLGLAPGIFTSGNYMDTINIYETPCAGYLTNGSKDICFFIPHNVTTGTPTLKNLAIAVRGGSGQEYLYEASGSNNTTYTQLGTTPVTVWENGATKRTNGIDSVSCIIRTKSGFRINISFKNTLRKSASTTVAQNNSPLGLAVSATIDFS